MSFTVTAISGLPEIRPGDDLGELIAAFSADLADSDILVVSHKAISKAEGRTRRLADVTPGDRARELAAAHEKDPRHVQVVLDESVELVRAERGILISRTRHGLVCANAGVDASNAPADGVLVLLPEDPDASARRLRARLREVSGAAPAVLVADSFGRAWRHGQADVAIGAAGLVPLEDWRGRHDSAGHELHATAIAVADLLTAAADLARSKDSRQPVVVISGLGRFRTDEDGPGAAALVRGVDEDLFR